MIRIAALILASNSAITLARFRPSKAASGDLNHDEQKVLFLFGGVDSEISGAL